MKPTMKRAMFKVLAAIGLAVALSGCIIAPWHHEGGGGGGGWSHHDNN
jgi:hypothetical protein